MSITSDFDGNMANPNMVVNIPSVSDTIVKANFVCALNSTISAVLTK
jgi:hypothetical protein